MRTSIEDDAIGKASFAGRRMPVFGTGSVPSSIKDAMRNAAGVDQPRWMMTAKLDDVIAEQIGQNPLQHSIFDRRDNVAGFILEPTLHQGDIGRLVETGPVFHSRNTIVSAVLAMPQRRSVKLVTT